MRYCLLILLILWGVSAPAQTLHLIMVSDVENKQFGKTSLGDEYALLNVAETTRSYLNYQLNTIYLNRRNFTAVAVRRVLDTLRTQPNDLIFWYYSGPGGYPAASQSQYPSFWLKDRKTMPLSLDEVALLLEQKKVRLVLAMADTRSKFPKRIDQVLPMIISEDLRKLIVEKLFLSFCGVVKVASTRRGETAYTAIARGKSAFMSAFYRAFLRTLKITTLQTLPSVSLIQLLKDTQLNIQTELRSVLPPASIQRVTWQLMPCQAIILQPFITPIRSFAGLPTQRSLDSLLNALTTKTLKSERKKTLSAISAIFTNDAVIKIKQVQSNTELNEVTLSKEQFINRINQYNSQVKQYYFRSIDTKRSQDFRYFSYLELTEYLN
jgi:hypothetical protein